MVDLLLSDTASGNSCNVLANAVEVWRMNVTEEGSIFDLENFVESNPDSEVTKVGEELFYTLPLKDDVALPEISPRIIYTLSGPEFPAGLSFNEDEGYIGGTPLFPTDGDLTYILGVKDTFSLVEFQTGTLNLRVDPPVTVVKSSSTDFITTYGYYLIIPVAVAIICYIIYWLYKRHDRRKLFHIFLSYRSLRL